MREVPECLNRRYEALDELIQELTSVPSRPQGLKLESASQHCESSNDPGIKLMCEFWNILKEDPDCNLTAASFDKKCNNKISQLMGTQKDLMEQIERLEEREKKGIQLLKQADCMWSCMEDAYKKIVEESLERQTILIKQLKDVEASHTKWRKNKKDLETQITNINKCLQDITDKGNQKKNDLKCMDMEINDFKKRIESNKYETDLAKKSLSHKKQASDIKVNSISADVAKLKKSLGEENRCKYNKEQDGSKYVKESREDLQKISRVLLQKKLENEDLRAEKDALLDEIHLLNQTMDQCKERCKNKQDTLIKDIKKLDAEISTFKSKCIRCHQSTDTIDIRKCCTDCPHCVEERDCIYEDGHCTPDNTMDCICMSVKQKFLDNVFDNMYTVLVRQSKTDPGKAVAEAILNCLKRSRNGKLNEQTKNILQDFILDTVKQNLNQTIIGGAVKTRCEMDPETYNQLMLCLNQVKPVKPPNEDKGTGAKKESCHRWGGASECNCPTGPKSCICTKKAPPPPHDPKPCPENLDKEDNLYEPAACPHKESTACGPLCAMHTVASGVGTDVTQWIPDPCSGSTCPFSKSMRAAQCMLGSESQSSLPESYMTTIPVLEDLISCRCGNTPKKPCTCRGHSKQLKAENIEGCDESTCATIWNQEADNDETRKESYAKYPASRQTVAKDMTRVQADVPFEKQYPLGTGQNIDINITGNRNVTFVEKDHSDTLPTKLTNTFSGSLAIALDEKIIELIDKKTSENPNITVNLKKTGPGEYFVDFKVENNAEDVYRVNKTSSGTRTFEAFNKLQSKDEIQFKTPYDIKIKNQNKNHKRTACSKNLTTNNMKSTGSQKLYYDLLQKYEAKNTLDVNVIGLNGLITKINAPLTKTLSGKLAVDIHEISLLGELNKVRAVILQESECGSYDVDISLSKECPNAVIRKTPSGGVFVVLTDTVLKSMETKPMPKEEFFRLQIKKTDCEMICPPAVLRRTSLNNFTIVIDKEYEKGYKRIVRDVLDDTTACVINMERISSENYLINFDDRYRCFKPNAMILRSSSGNIKIIKNISTQTALPRRCLGLKVYNELLRKLSLSHKEFHAESCQSPVISRVKSRSESNMYEKFKIISPDEADNKLKKTSVLKKTSSGQLAVVLGKQSEKAFINNLNGYLQSNSQGVLPVKITNTGEFTIILNNDLKENNYYDPLKFTPSGNIYVMGDENIVKGMEKRNSVKNDATATNMPDTKSIHMVGNLSLPVNKAVTTFCNAKPDECCCNPSKCECKVDYSLDTIHIEDCFKLYEPQMCGKDWTRAKKSPNRSYNICKLNKCTLKGKSTTAEQEYKLSRNQQLTHIVIKPYKQALNPCTEEQCFSIVKPMCHFLKNKNNSVINHLLETSSLCNEINVASMSKNSNSVKVKHIIVRNDKSYSDWDSLHFLPPQLPAFLRDFKYR